ncbi:hypothetical protein [Arthrobacter sp. GAS37]|uniref:hypothetical protein n=1 Tax=Arthrobacter sp. GAS37 TaxID=3156261 RepID=UPI003850D545
MIRDGDLEGLQPGTRTEPPQRTGAHGLASEVLGPAFSFDARDLALPAGFTDLLGELKNRVRAARTQAIRTVNTQLIAPHWSIGKTILERKQLKDGGAGSSEGWPKTWELSSRT